MNLKINESIFIQFPVLESERLILRREEKKDAIDILQIRSDQQVMKYMDSTPLQSIADAENRITTNQKLFDEKKGINWMIINKESNTLIGDFGFWRLDKKNSRAEIGYTLKSDYWGKGFMSETMRRCLKFAFEKMNVHSIEANVNPKNENSKQLLLKIGFQQEAYFRENYYYDGQFLDSVIFCLLKSDFEKNI